jgi:hypothetical protein
MACHQGLFMFNKNRLDMMAGKSTANPSYGWSKKETLPSGKLR